MSQKTNSSLSTKRILISLAIFLAIPVTTRILNIFAEEIDICYTTTINIAAFALLFYDWNLFTIHYNRSKYDLSSTALYFLIGLGLIGCLIFLNDILIQGTLVIPDDYSLTRYGYARVGMYFAFSFSQGLVLTISYKCLTDRFNVHGKELQVILLSSFLFAFVYLIFFIPFSLEIWIRTYLYNVLLFMILSYLYNQSHSLIPGLLSFSLLYFLIIFIR